MRSFLVAVALLLAFVAGTASLTAYVAHRTVLDPQHSGRLLSAALQQPALRQQLLEAAVPGYENLPAPLKEGLDQVAGSPRFAAAVRHLRVDAQGRVHLGPLRKRIERELRAHGEDQLATALSYLPAPDTVQLPGTYVTRLRDAREAAWLVATRGGAVAVGLLLLALLVSPHRRRTLRAAGVTVLLSCGATALLWWVAPVVVDVLSSPAWAQAAASARKAYTPLAVATLVPVAVAGAVVAVVSFLVPRRQG